MTLIFVVLLFSFSWHALGRLLFFYLGAILCLGPANLTPAKIVYIVGLIFLAFKSLLQIRRWKISNLFNYSHIRIIAFYSFLLIFFNLVVSLSKGFTVLEVLRSLTGIILFFCGIPIYLLCGLKIKTSFIFDLAVIIGVFSAASFWYKWSQGHGLNLFGSDRFALDSEWTALLGFSISLNTKVVSKIRKFLYPVSTLAVAFFMLLSLTRTNIILMIWITIFSLFSRSGKFRKIALIAITSFSGFVFLRAFLPDLFNNAAFVERIFVSWQKFSSGGLGSTGIGSDQSVIMRSQQTTIATHLFFDNLFFGSGQLPANKTFDTFMGTIAKFGLIGNTLFAILYFKIFQLFFQQRRLKQFDFFIPLSSALVPASLIYDWPSGRSIWLALGMILVIYVSKSDYLPNLKILSVGSS